MLPVNFSSSECLSSDRTTKVDVQKGGLGRAFSAALDKPSFGSSLDKWNATEKSYTGDSVRNMHRHFDFVIMPSLLPQVESREDDGRQDVERKGGGLTNLRDTYHGSVALELLHIQCTYAPRKKKEQEQEQAQ